MKTTTNTKPAALTPADIGALAVTLDDCRADNLGDDDTMDRLTRTAEREGFSPALAYAWFRSECGKR